MFKPAKILVPTDMSSHSDKAVKQAIDIAKQFNSELYLLHVVQDPAQQCIPDYDVNEGLLLQLQKELLELAHKGIQAQIDKFPESKGLTIVADVKTGVPHDEILKEEVERGIDLVVISSLGTTGLAKYLIGSVARHVLLGSTCSVLLVR